MDKKQKAIFPNRETVVVHSEVASGADFRFPILVACNKPPEDVNESDWFAVITKKTGMGKIEISRYAYQTKLEAEEQVKTHPVGKRIEGFDKVSFILKNDIPTEYLLEFTGAGDGDAFHYACYIALVDCGVKTISFDTAKVVLDDFSNEDKAAYKSKYGEIWTVALEAKYVLSRYHITSLAGYAARIFFCYYILEDDYAVGYLWREMEMVLSESEKIALKEVERKKASREMSAKANRRNRASRIESMLSAMEVIVSENPALKRKSARQFLADLAIENAIKSDPKLWSQGKDQRDNYLSAMKTDEPFNKRFEALDLH